MNSFNHLYINFLKNQLNQRIERNPSYSLRAFAKHLDASPGALSGILNGKRTLTLKKAIDWSEKLGLSEQQSDEFLDAVTKAEIAKTSSLNRETKKIKQKYQYYLLKLDQFKIITEWYHIGILNLTELDDFKFDIPWISKKLDIAEDDAREAIERLLRLELLEYNNGELFRTKVRIETPNDIPNEAIKSFHTQNIERALDSLKKDDVEEREITSIMMPADSKKLEEAKQKIRNFAKELSGFLQDGKKEKVYSLNIQLFPQTNLEEGKNYA